MNTLYHMWVYNRNDLVARVDYDYCRNYVSVENYTDNIFIRPFGIKEDVTISDLEAFFEERVRSPNRADIKEILDYYGMKSYDAYELVLKTHGSQFGDYIWVKFDENDPYCFEDLLASRGITNEKSDL